MENKRITKPQLAFQYCKEIAKSINEYVLSTVEYNKTDKI